MGQVRFGHRRRDDVGVRPCFINPRSTHADVEALVDTVIAIGDDLTASD